MDSNAHHLINVRLPGPALQNPHRVSIAGRPACVNAGTGEVDVAQVVLVIKSRRVEPGPIADTYYSGKPAARIASIRGIASADTLPKAEHCVVDEKDDHWYADLFWIFVPIQGEIAEFGATLKDYPPNLL